MQVELTDAELDLIKDILRSAYSDLREEIVKTEGSHFKDQLRARETLLQAVIEKFAAAA